MEPGGRSRLLAAGPPKSYTCSVQLRVEAEVPLGKEAPDMAAHKRGRDARNGQFIPVKVAQRRKSTAVVEHVKPKKQK